MGLTKQYVRYTPAGSFNIIATQNCNVCFVTLEAQVGRFVAVGACENIIIWDLRLGEKAQVLPGEKSAVTALCTSPNKRHIAAGYSDGTVQIHDLKSAEVLSIFAGHKTDITTLSYDNFGHKLASGSKDTDVIVWDTVAESGLCRFSGHRGAITQVVFMLQQPVLISASKDTFVKFWDLDTQHCFKTLVGHQTEVWAMRILKEDRYLVTGCGDAELRVWKLIVREPESENKSPEEHLSSILQIASLDEGDDAAHPLQCHKVGSLLRGGRGRVVSLFTDESGQVVGCHGTDNQLELFYFCSDDEAKVRLKKRLKKERKKEKKSDGENPVEPMEIDQQIVSADLQLSLKDEVKRLSSINLPSKPKSLDLVLGNGGELRIAVTLANNTVELYTIQTDVKEAKAKCLRSILHQGHHSEVRSVAFSSDNLAIVSGSAECIKMWNRPSQACLRTVDTGYVLSTAFVPGDRHVLAGLKDGRLQIVDIAAGDVLEDIPAHTGELRSICIQPDLRGCATGGADQTVKFWQFELILDKASESKAKVLSLLHTRTLKLEEQVLCLKISPNSKFVAVALMDSTVKLFFMDTFKFYLSLYGHKLPVLCMDISSDSTLIATGSSDRNVKLWGMDFGDCHKSIFAHDDSVTGLQFVPRTHYFFTCGKDGKVKEWDGDTYDKIITLHGHHGEAWSLAVSPNGQFVVSCGADRVLRMYEKSEQPLILQDEQEEEREEQDALATSEQSVVPGQPGLNLPSKRTIGSEKAAESILECLEVISKYKIQLEEHESLQRSSGQTVPEPPLPLLMQAFNVSTTEDFFLETMKRIRPSDLEEALLILPFSAVESVLSTLPALISRGDEIELVCKVIIFLLKLHHAPIVANQALLSTIQLLQSAKNKVKELRDLVGFNFYGMQLIQREIETRDSVQLFKDATMQRKKNEKSRKQREKLKRSIMVLS